MFAPGAIPQAQNTAALTGPYRIAGTVVNAETGMPVRGAMVAILTVEDNSTFASTETDGEGRFALERLPAGKFQLTASKRGYLTSLYEQHENFDSAIVTGADQETGKVVFKLTPGAVLSGVVTGDGGDPVASATVMLFKKPEGHGPAAVVEEAGSETTDDTGAYEFTGLEAGEYWVAVNAVPWYATRDGGGGNRARAPETEQQEALDVAYPLTYFDSTTEEGSATPIELSGGSRQEANVSLHAVPALHITLPIPSGPERTPVPIPSIMQMVFGRPVGSGNFDLVSNGSGGPAIEGLAPGQYEIQQGEPPRMAITNLAASQQLDPDAGEAAVEVKGTIVDARGAPLKDAIAILNPLKGTAGSVPGQDAQRGAFRFEAIPPGEWRLQIDSPAGTAVLPIIAVTENGKTQAGDKVTVGEQPVSLRVMVSVNAARVEGFARRDGKGVAGVMVVLVPKDPAAMPSLVRRDESDSDGSFGLLNVAPGNYTVVAIADGWDVDWSDPQAMARYLPGGISVTVKDEGNNAPGGQAPQRISLAAAVPVQPK
jgi:protocatechuate 3,4-dioxygenase beta subunit